MIKLSDLVFDFIVNKEISKVFMLPGGGAMHLVDSLGNNKYLDYIPMHHEQAVGIAAEYFGRVDENIGVALVTTGPGATNIITPFIGAWIESVPLLVISGQVKSKDMMGYEDNVRQSGVQEVKIVEMIKKNSKYAVTVTDPHKIRYHLEKAFYLINDGRKGPAWLDIPLDIQASQIPDFEDLESFYKQNSILLNKNKPLSTQNKSLLDEFYENLKSSKRPLAIFGHGCRLSGSHKLVNKLIQHLSIPSVFTWNASDLLPFNDDLYVGKPGNVALRAPNIAIQTCDIFISFGARLDNIVTAYDSKNFARNAKNKYLVDIDKFQMSKSDISYAKNICLDFKLAAEYLLQKEPLKEIKNWKEHCKNLKNKFSVCDGKIPKDSKKITHFEIVEYLSKALPNDSLIVTGSSGLAIESFYTAFKNKEGQRILLTSGLGAMGYGLPAFIGACFSKKYKKKYLIESDGSLQLNIQELATLTQINDGVKLIILNNNGYTSIRVTQDGYFGGNRVGSDKKSGLLMPNLKEIAYSYGIKYIKISKNNLQLLNNLLISDEKILIDIELIENEKLWPKVAAFQEENGNMSSMPLEDMNPLLSISELKEALLNCDILEKSINVRKRE